MQQPQHQDPHAQEQPRRIFGRPWPKGRSANPSGKTRAQRHLEAFTSLFRDTHSREPNAVEAAMLKNAAACASKAEGHGVKVEHVVRCGRLLSQLLNDLGLAGAPSPPAAPKPTTLKEYAAAKNGAKR